MPVSVHLDHVESVELVHEAVELGVGSVMFDASKLDYEENVAQTREVVAWCHERGVGVEAELGEVGGKDGVHAPGARTDPDEAAEYVGPRGSTPWPWPWGRRTRCRPATPAGPRPHRPARRDVPVPLVLHGSSGLSDEELAPPSRSGMTKVNISTHLNGVFTRAVRAVLADRPDLTDPRKYVAAGRAALEDETERLLRLLAGTA